MSYLACTAGFACMSQGESRLTSTLLSVAAVHSLKPGSSLGPWDFVPYAEGVTTSVLWGRYASMAWND